jgi:hypothetical protein
MRFNHSKWGFDMVPVTCPFKQFWELLWGSICETGWYADYPLRNWHIQSIISEYHPIIGQGPCIVHIQIVSSYVMLHIYIQYDCIRYIQTEHDQNNVYIWSYYEYTCMMNIHIHRRMRILHLSRPQGINACRWPASQLCPLSMSWMWRSELSAASWWKQRFWGRKTHV